MRLPKAVLFDLDGTLLDSEHLWLKAEMSTMSHWNVNWTSVDQQICLGGPFERVATYMHNLVTDHDDPSPTTLQGISDLLLANIVELFSTTRIAWRPGARDLVLQAHKLGIPTAIVTASWRVLLDAVLANMSADVGEFTVTVAGDEVPRSKPDPFPYARAARLLHVDPGDCLAIEDSPTGTASAVSSGAKTIAIQHVTAITVPGAVVIDTLEGLSLEKLWSLFWDGQS